MAGKTLKIRRPDAEAVSDAEEELLEELDDEATESLAVSYGEIFEAGDVAQMILSSASALLETARRVSQATKDGGLDVELFQTAVATTLQSAEFIDLIASTVQTRVQGIINGAMGNIVQEARGAMADELRAILVEFTGQDEDVSEAATTEVAPLPQQ